MSQTAFQASAFENDAFQIQPAGVDPQFLTPCTRRALAKLGITVMLLICVLPIYG